MFQLETSKRSTAGRSKKLIALAVGGLLILGCGTGIANAAVKKSSKAPSGILSKIAKCESGSIPTKKVTGFNPSSKNGHTKRTASGLYQITEGTWGGYGGYKYAYQAPVAVQTAKAQQLIAKNGTRDWNASRSCWSK